MSYWGQIVGLPSIEEAERDKHSERVSEGIRRSRNRKQTRRLQYLRDKVAARVQGKSWYEVTWPGLEGRYRHTRNEMKRRFRKALNKMAYLRWGIIEPRKGTGHKSKTHDEWQCKMNFIAQGWNPSDGSLSEEVPSGRWDLDETDWANLWRGWTVKMASEYGAYRVDPKGNFEVSNMTLAKKASRQFK